MKPPPSLPANGARSTDIERTVKRRIDVAEAFRDESPTTPAASEARILAAQPEAKRAPTDDVCMLVPLDTVPVLSAVKLPWDTLGDLATNLLRRIDGATSTMRLVIETRVAASDSVRELATLACRGLVRLAPSAEAAHVEPTLGLDLSELDLEWR
jgi:hypothetical protein